MDALVAESRFIQDAQPSWVVNDSAAHHGGRGGATLQGVALRKNLPGGQTIEIHGPQENLTCTERLSGGACDRASGRRLEDSISIVAKNTTGGREAQGPTEPVVGVVR